MKYQNDSDMFGATKVHSVALFVALITICKSDECKLLLIGVGVNISFER